MDDLFIRTLRGDWTATPKSVVAFEKKFRRRLLSQAASVSRLIRGCAGAVERPLFSLMSIAIEFPFDIGNYIGVLLRVQLLLQPPERDADNVAMMQSPADAGAIRQLLP